MNTKEVIEVIRSMQSDLTMYSVRPQMQEFEQANSELAEANSELKRSNEARRAEIDRLNALVADLQMTSGRADLERRIGELESMWKAEIELHLACQRARDEIFQKAAQFEKELHIALLARDRAEQDLEHTSLRLNEARSCIEGQNAVIQTLRRDHVSEYVDYQDRYAERIKEVGGIDKVENAVIDVPADLILRLTNSLRRVKAGIFDAQLEDAEKHAFQMLEDQTMSDGEHGGVEDDEEPPPSTIELWLQEVAKRGLPTIESFGSGFCSSGIMPGQLAIGKDGWPYEMVDGRWTRIEYPYAPQPTHPTIYPIGHIGEVDESSDAIAVAITESYESQWPSQSTNDGLDEATRFWLQKIVEKGLPSIAVFEQGDGIVAEGYMAMDENGWPCVYHDGNWVKMQFSAS